MPTGKYIRTDKHRSILKGRVRLDMLGDKNPAKREDVRAKLRANCGGKPLSAAHRLKLRNAKLGTHCSEETKQKLRDKRVHQVFPQRDSSIEVLLQSALTTAGVSYTTHASLKGQPDIFILPNICVFADGCYWHHCPQCGYTNTDDTDSRVTAHLTNTGYTVLRFWEHDIIHNIDACITHIHDAIKPA